jgi:YbgC/YbaW family acyl-CoA thioester hydrolase
VIATQARDGWQVPPPPANPARASHRVRVHDLDSLGHVNNAVYLDVVAQAAFDAFEAAGWSLERLVVENTVPALVRADLEYLEAARYGDALDTHTWFTALDDGIDIHQDVKRESDGRTLVRATTGWRWVEPRSGAAANVPTGLLAALAPLRAA